MIYTVCRALVALAAHICYRIDVAGAENVPPQGGVLLCSNHSSWWDIIAVGMTSRRQLRFMAKEELFHYPVFGWLLRQLGAFPVRRGHADRSALKGGLQLLSKGEIVAIFPEGTRIKTVELGQAKPGVGFLAARSGATVVPVGISSSYRLFSRIKVRYGPPLDLTRYQGSKVDSAQLEQLSQEIMDGIAALVDLKMRVRRTAVS